MAINIIRIKKKCIELLTRIEHEGAYTHLVLQRVAESGELAPAEYPILLQLVRGSLEQKGVIEIELEKLLPKGLSSLPKDIQLILRLSAYQILFLDRVKKRDVVFEGVELAKASRQAGFAGLVNAVLRRINSGDERATATSNFPDWLVARWIEQHGQEEVERFCTATGSNLPIYCRVNSRLISPSDLIALLQSEGGVASESVVESPNSLKLTSIPSKVRITRLESYLKGLFFIQDLSSTLVADIVAAGSPRRVSDLCAAPGGKACSIAISVKSSGGVIYASDRSKKRVSLIKQLADRLGTSNVIIDEFELGRARGRSKIKLCDRVLLDVPCSGFGTVGRKVDVRWSITPTELSDLIRSQARLLGAAAEFVEPGGELIYSTCSIDYGENEGVVEEFLGVRSDFVKVDLRESLPSHLCTPSGFFRTWPHRHAMTGAFAARLRREKRA